MRSLLTLAAACCFLAAAFGEESDTVDYDEFADIVAKKSAYIIDANSTPTFARLHIRGAVSYYAPDFEDLLPQDKGAPIVVYCASARCNAWQKAADRLMQLGFTNVKHFPGGFEVWRMHEGAVDSQMKKFRDQQESDGQETAEQQPAEASPQPAAASQP